ncbi:MAG: VOC family protein [Oligoflexus sp.]
MNKIETCLWFDKQGEEAAKFYTSLFKNTKLGGKAYYSKAASQASEQAQGTVMTQEFTIENQHGVVMKYTKPILADVEAAARS